ncbi:MAG: uracil-DNA glycosylase [Phycisphaerales bacterium]|nr:uracil-DNA glycosylase [Phycisphaerales bacterium]
MSDEARILISQHAKTSELLGVDFLPLGKGMIQGADVDEGVAGFVPHKNDERSQVSSGNGESVPDLESTPSLGKDQHSEPISAQELRATYESANGAQAQLEALSGKYNLEAPHQFFCHQFNNIVFGEGDPSADLMFIGEAPGEQEDLCGRPFVGPAGELLEKMIGAMGLSRERVYICNVLKTRPTNNATPTSEESALCAPYLWEQIRIVQPKVIVTLGLPASQLILGKNETMRSMRGQWHGMIAGADELPEVEVMATYHPAYLLRSYTPENRRKVWSDLTQVIEKLGLSKE